MSFHYAHKKDKSQFVIFFVAIEMNGLIPIISEFTLRDSTGKNLRWFKNRAEAQKEVTRILSEPSRVQYLAYDIRRINKLKSELHFVGG